MKRQISLLLVLVMLAFSTSACTNMSKSQQGALSGSAIGAAAGLGIAAIAGGNLAVGAAVGGALVGAAGYIHGSNQQNQNR